MLVCTISAHITALVLQAAKYIDPHFFIIVWNTLYRTRGFQSYAETSVQGNPEEGRSFAFCSKNNFGPLQIDHNLWLINKFMPKILILGFLGVLALETKVFQ